MMAPGFTAPSSTCTYFVWLLEVALEIHEARRWNPHGDGPRESRRIMMGSVVPGESFGEFWSLLRENSCLMMVHNLWWWPNGIVLNIESGTYSVHSFAMWSGTGCDPQPLLFGLVCSESLIADENGNMTIANKNKQSAGNYDLDWFYWVVDSPTIC